MKVKDIAARMVLLLILLPLALPSALARSTKSKMFLSLTRLGQEITTAPPVDGEVCFSPDEPCDQKLIKFVKTAQRSIDVAIYDINLDQLIHELIVAARTKQVRVVVEYRQSKGGHSLVSTLVKAGVSVRKGKQRGIMHNKFVIIDGEKVETGSFNYTNHAREANQENQVYIFNPKTVARYVERYRKIWGTAAAY